MLRLLILLCFVAILPTPTLAGAWQREADKVFLSFGGSVHRRESTGLIEPEYSFFGEYGVAPKLTLAVNSFRRGDTEGHTLALVRFPLHQTKNGAHFASEIGLGRRESRGQSAMIYTVGLSWGRGMQIGERSGWLSVDSTVQLPASGDPLLKVDSTAGLSIAKDSKIMGQIFLEADAQGRSITVAPSYVRRLNRASSDLVLGLDWRRGRQAGVGVRIGMWRSF